LQAARGSRIEGSMMDNLLSAGALSAFLQVVLIDLVLAGDNAVAVGVSAAGVPAPQRRRVILWGLIAAVVIRIGFAVIATKLIGLIGLLFAGGLLLLWVCWKLWRELRAQAVAEEAEAEAVLEGGSPPAAKPAKSFRSAFTQILLADISMSLDNVLAVAGAAREHPAVLVLGLLLSVGLMGVAASWIARMLHRFRWIAYLGLAIVLYVALHMMWEGHRDLVRGLGKTQEYNRLMPDVLDIKPKR
jgi:YjbE family integral membrane protein